MATLRSVFLPRWPWRRKPAVPHAPPSDADPELQRKLTWIGSAAAGGRFLSIYMDQNNRCNLKCRMCGFSDARMAALAKYDLPRSLFEKIAEQVFPKTHFVCLSILTEPFMTRDFPDRLALVQKAGVPYSEIITNGTLLNETNLAKVLDAGISRLTFSIDGGTKEVFEAIRTGARFEQVVGNVRLFQTMRRARGAERPRVRFNHVLSERNIDHFDEFLCFVEEIRPEEMGVRTVSRMSDAEIQESQDPVFWSKVAAARQRLAAFYARTGIEDSGYLRDRPSRIDLLDAAGMRMICRTPWDTLAIHANGDVFPCMAWARPPVGNLVLQSFEEIWNGDALEALRREFARVQPGVDCLNCTIRRSGDDPDDDFFYRKVAKPLPALRS
jgi:radical SAM protein with 4Fe4S-binding SPASM domain